MLLVFALLFALLGIASFANLGYIYAKAEFAQYLMKDAWTDAQQSGQYQRPWWWADTHVLGKISYLDSQHYILEGESGRNLAFGPSLMANTSSLDAVGNTVIVGHRDTHFKQLQYLISGDIINIESLGGNVSYEVQESAVIKHDDIGVLAHSDMNMLTLVTCYPFDSILANPELRYVIRAIALK